MTATMVERAIAPVVTETTWGDADDRHTYRTAHHVETCTRIKRTEIVARDIDLATREAGMPCDYCWPATEQSEPVQHVEREAAQRPAHGVPAPEATTTPPARPIRPPGSRPNRYAGTCDTCGSEVAAESGILTGSRGAWGARHLPGDCQTGAGRAAGAAASRADTGSDAPLPDVAAGHYAIPTSKGHLFVKVDRPADGRWAGRTFVKQIIGGHPADPVRGAYARRVLETIATDPDGAAALYGQEIGRCYRCNRVLTDPESRRLGIGPECRGKRSTS